MDQSHYEQRQLFEMNLKGKKRSGILLRERQKNNGVKLERHHIIALVEFRQRQRVQ